MAKELNVEPKVLADDVMAIARGTRMLRRLASALRATHCHLQDMGAKIAPAKCFNFASTPKARKWLEETWWDAIAAKVPVLIDFRHLGAHLNNGGGRRAATLHARAGRGIAQLRRTARLRARPEEKAKTIRAKVHAGTFYGIEGSDLTDTQVASLSAATIQVFKQTNSRYDVDWHYATCSHGKDLDPNVQVVLRRIVGLRRAHCKGPHMQHKLRSIMNLYAQREGFTKWLHTGPDATYHDPAPHPSRASTAAWKHTIETKGPVGFLIQVVYCMGALIDKQSRIWQQCETELNLIPTPYQHLGPLVLEAAARARTKAAQGTKTLNRGLEEIDAQVTLNCRRTMSTEDQAMLRTIQCGGGISKIDLQAMGVAQDTTCDYCGHHTCDMDHILWQCPQFSNARAEADAELANIGARLMNPAVRRGIAPAMRSASNVAFWGLDLNRIENASQDAITLFGCVPQEDRDVQECLDEARQPGKNARQLMACLRGGFGTGGSPTFPLQVDGDIPEEPNGYTDGGLVNPSTVVGTRSLRSMVATPKSRRQLLQRNGRAAIRTSRCDRRRYRPVGQDDRPEEQFYTH